MTSEPQPTSLALLQGTLDLLILEALRGGPLHGYGVARLLRERSGDALQVEEGALYTALHRMEERGWLVSKWGVSETGRRARFYRLTPVGRRQLHKQSRGFARYAGAVFRVLGLRPEEAP
ncbi:MAG TPA: PadR family transcriptional regulator [Thermoanaerobaculia bacterium]|nr:PadR family transcriptional regulator [Thermoanaerobaculia bacterium]